MKVNFHVFFRNILFFLYILYFSQGLTYASGTLISQVSLFIIILIAVVYFIKSLVEKNNKTKFYWAWTLLLCVNVIGFIFTMEFDVLHVDMLKNTLVCMLTFYPFYCFSKHKILQPKYMIVFFIIMLTINIFQFYKTQSILQELRGQENIVNNLAYSFVALIPYVFLLKNQKLLSGITLGVILYFILISAKRGAIVTASIGTIVFVYYQFKTIKRNKRVIGYLFVLLFTLVLGYFAYITYNNNEFLVMRMAGIAEGDSSGRDIIYMNIFNSWKNSDNILNVLFGYGFAGSLKLSGTGSYAHNDWLELLSNFGLIGVLIYLILFIFAIKETTNKNRKIDKKILMYTIIGMWFSTTLFSMWYTSITSSIQVILIAYLIGYKQFSLRELLKQKINENSLRNR